MVGIYKITNLINNKVYIGQSSDIERRFNEHKHDPFEQNNHGYNYIFYQAIREYGIDNFSFEILETCSIKELNEKEKYWIKYYNSYIGWNQSNGYNMTIGGQGTRKFDPQEIIKLWNNGFKVEEIMKELNASYNTVIHYLHQENLGYLDLKDRKTLYSLPKAIEQYSLDGKFIRSYESISDAIRMLKKENPKVHTVNISYACKHKITTAYNYIWKYSNDLISIEELVALANTKTHHCNRPVNQYDINGNFIQTFSTIKEAQIATNLKSSSSIINVCKGKSLTAGGYIWKYSDIAKGG